MFMNMTNYFELETDHIVKMKCYLLNKYSRTLKKILQINLENENFSFVANIIKSSFMQQVHVSFVDVQKAFDRIKRK